MRIGFDIDGVLACFYAAYEDLCIKHAGKDLFGPHRWPNEVPCVWDWPEYWGYPKSLMDFKSGPVWTEIRTSESFWLTLKPMPEMSDVRLFLSDGAHEVYFVTDRSGPSVKRQTELWLMRHGVVCPTVIISRKGKGVVCDALSLDWYIDDKGENIVDVEAKSPHTHGVLLERPYNQHVAVRHRSVRLIDALP